MQICAECGMPVDKATTYHPYAACLMFKACQNSAVVQANLDAVVAHGLVEPAGWVRIVPGHSGPVAAEVEWHQEKPERAGFWRAIYFKTTNV